MKTEPVCQPSMTMLSMAIDAMQAIRQGSVSGCVYKAKKGSWPRGMPRGELLDEYRLNDGSVVEIRGIHPMQILKWLERHGVVKIHGDRDFTLVL